MEGCPSWPGCGFRSGCNGSWQGSTHKHTHDENLAGHTFKLSILAGRHSRHSMLQQQAYCAEQ